MKSQVMRVAVLAVALSVVGWLPVHPAPRVASSAAGTLVATGDMSAIRFDHAAALLPSGRVLIVGGIERNGVMQSSAEVFDPGTARFTPTGNLQAQHGWGVTATLLRSGKVLIAGGSGDCASPCYTRLAELYDSNTNAFTRTGAMTVPRAESRAVLLPGGDVLFVGGVESGATTAELYHPASSTFSATGATHIRDVVQVVLLKTGYVLVMGASDADLYDPSTGRFTRTGGLNVPRTKFGAALLPDGRVLIAGGQAGGPWGVRVSSTESYNPVSGKFTPGPELNVKRFKLSKAVVALKNGDVLIAGGADQPELYDPATNSFLEVRGAKLDGFCFSTATVLNDGRVLLAGGYAMPGNAGVNHAWLYQPPS